MLSQAMAQRIELWPLDRLVPYTKNPRTHSEAQVAQIAASIAEFGFNNPILVDTKAASSPLIWRLPGRVAGAPLWFRPDLHWLRGGDWNGDVIDTSGARIGGGLLRFSDCFAIG
ncbi:MAG TPA: ParB N-terminal domain-containing protein [Bryobacteraceae bacterium]|jgi:hypothetical protein|nr:ParB N-terminal domain-containing protein [Bryobacteraceae bacterium]